MKRKLFLLLPLVIALTSIPLATSLAFDSVTPEEAYEITTSYPDVYILDVRTAAEWRWVGHPGPNLLDEGSALAGKVINISFIIQKGSAYVRNPSFLSDVNEVFEDMPSLTLITMCLSGGRSAAAATLLEGAGYDVLNMVNGFEGFPDSRGYRIVNGWRNIELPYSYSGAGYGD